MQVTDRLLSNRKIGIGKHKEYFKNTCVRENYLCIGVDIEVSWNYHAILAPWTRSKFFSLDTSQPRRRKQMSFIENWDFCCKPSRYFCLVRHLFPRDIIYYVQIWVNLIWIYVVVFCNKTFLHKLFFIVRNSGCFAWLISDSKW